MSFPPHIHTHTHVCNLSAKQTTSTTKAVPFLCKVREERWPQPVAVSCLVTETARTQGGAGSGRMLLWSWGSWLAGPSRLREQHEPSGQAPSTVFFISHLPGISPGTLWGPWPPTLAAISGARESPERALVEEGAAVQLLSQVSAQNAGRTWGFAFCRPAETAIPSKPRKSFRRRPL